MNKQSNSYTVIYIIVMVIVVGAALAFVSMSLSERQTDNINADKMRQILASAHITPDTDIKADYNRYITDSFVVNAAGERIDGVAFDIKVAEQVKLPADSRALPVFVATMDDNTTKYILPVYGAGLWGPIWGYVAINDDGSTIYGAYFAHESETPGLGAEIAKPAFSDKFIGKQLFKNGIFRSVAVVKAGQKPADDADYIDGKSGGTITSKGVGAMLYDCLQPYAPFLQTLKK